MARTPKGPKYSIGKEGAFSYNSHSRRVCPSDWVFTIFTVALIVIPTALVLVVVVPMNEKIPIWLMILLEILICVTVFLSLRMLFKCATTDPGVIPNASVYNSGITDQNKCKIDLKKEYYAKYLDRNELNQVMN